MRTGLARVTVSGPRRRVDLAVPEHVPVAELLPALLRHSGDGLADEGEKHGGWVLRRTDGSSLQTAYTLGQQGVRDGELLHLLPARTDWPEPEYDDVVEAVAEGARRAAVAWSGAATRAATLAAASVALAVGLFAILQAGPDGSPGPALALGAAVLLGVAAVLASRAWGDAPVAVTLGGWAMPYAFVAGALQVTSGDPVGALGPVRWLGAPELLAGSSLLLLVAAAGMFAVVAGLRWFVAGTTVAVVGAVSALVGMSLSTAATAAVLLSALVCGIGGLPLLAVRFGRLLPAAVGRWDPDDGKAVSEAPGARETRAVVFTAVARSHELLTGLLVGHAVLAGAAMLLLATAGGWSGRLLVAVSAAVLLLRARTFVARSQRLPLVVAGLTGFGVLATALVGVGGSLGVVAICTAALLLALLTAAAGAAYARRPPSPYLTRAADVCDVALTVSVVPVACAVLDLYARAQALIG
ncbi:MAG TPA: type VII secretion integral membrane protein EccD [Micromonosporaceae bacterium]